MLYILIYKGVILGSSLLVLLLNWPRFQLVFREAQKAERAVCFFSFVGRADCSLCWCWFVCVWVLVIFTVSMEYQLMERKKSFCLLAGQLSAFSLEYWVLLEIYLKITTRRPKTNHLLLLLKGCCNVHWSCWRVWTLPCLCFRAVCPGTLLGFLHTGKPWWHDQFWSVTTECSQSTTFDILAFIG